MSRRWTFVIAFALVFYGTGAAFVEGFVNYPGWQLIGPDEFITYHQFISPRVLAFLVAPLILGTVFTILMLWSRPAAIPAWAGRAPRPPDRDELLAAPRALRRLCRCSCGWRRW